MKTLYLHIGTHKTATTSIQRFCALNREVLDKKGYFYPLFPFRYPRISADRNGSFLGGVLRDDEDVRHKELEQANFDEALRIIHEAFETHEAVVLSDEAMWVNLYSKNSKMLSNIKKDSEEHGYQIRAIIYLRRQDKFIESWWHQRIKAKHDLTDDFQKFIDGYRYLDYNAILTHFADILGEDCITVRRFDEIVKTVGMLPDFMHMIGLELTDEYEPLDGFLNTSLYGYTTEVKRVINGLQDYDIDDNRLFKKSLATSAKSSKNSYKCSEFSVEERTAFMSRFEEGNQAIADRFIKDGKPLFSDDYSGPPKREDVTEDYLEDVIRASAATDVLLDRQLRKLEQKEASLKERVSTLRKQMREMEEQLRAHEKQLEKHETRIEHLRHPLRTLSGKIK